MKRTRYFKSCLGVFEGGGVRGSALAGAYASAVASGISFERVAGTSAGSIVASVIATGVEPNFVLDKLKATDFKQFLTKPVSSERAYRSGFGQRSLRKLSIGKSRSLLTISVESGLYSSRAIQAWTEATLREALEQVGIAPQHDFVRFRDLPIPLHVVASDLRKGEAQIWSQETHGDTSVAHAVRCSSSIPFFFQAVNDSDGAIYVDGALVSNLPSFVFSDLLRAPNSHSTLARVLCFRLVDSTEGAPATDVGGLSELISMIGSTAVSGATTLQMSLQPDASYVEIDAKGVKATDFESISDEQKAELVESGKQAVVKFVASEEAHVRSQITTTECQGFDAQLALLAQSVDSALETITVSAKSAYFLHFLFPLFVIARIRGVRICFLGQRAPDLPPAHQSTERHCRALMQKLGAEIKEVDSIPFDGFLFDINTDQASALLSGPETSLDDPAIYNSESARLYRAPFDTVVLKCLQSMLENAHRFVKDAREPPSFQICNGQDCQLMEQRIMSDTAYSDASAEFSEINISNSLKAVTRNVKEAKLIQIERLIEQYNSLGVEKFRPLKILFYDGSFSFVTPPVIEVVESDHVIIEGLTRSYFCLKNGITRMKALIIRGAKRLPGEARPLPYVRPTSRTVRREELLFNAYPDAIWRKIEQNMHPKEDLGL